jgi:hypothetical protein
VDCGEDNFILTQVNKTIEAIFIFSDYYNLKYSKEVQNEIRHTEKGKRKKQKKEKTKRKNLVFIG